MLDFFKGFARDVVNIIGSTFQTYVMQSKIHKSGHQHQLYAGKVNFQSQIYLSESVSHSPAVHT